MIAAAVGMLLLLTALSSDAQAKSYVALGDSYSSGLGTRDYYDDGTDCKRSPAAYGPLLAKRNGLALTLAACQGAITRDVAGQQLQSLSGSTAYITLTVGGNDVGFAPVLNECARPGWMSDCNGKLQQARRVAQTELPGRLDSLYGEILRRAPNARVAVSGYPRLFMGEDCDAFTFFSPEEQAALNAATDELNGIIRGRAEAAGFTFVDPVPAFIGRAVCDPEPWINGLSNPVNESYHPNKGGHGGYAGVFAGGLGVAAGGAAAMSAPESAPADPVLPPAQARPDALRLPDLDSSAARRAARDAGVRPRDLRAFNAARRDGDRRRAAAVKGRIDR